MVCGSRGAAAATRRLQQIGNNRDRSGISAGAVSAESRLATKLAGADHDVLAADNASERRGQRHERRLDRQIYAPVLQLRGCYLADGATELARVFEVDGCDVANRATDDLLGRHIDLRVPLAPGSPAWQPHRGHRGRRSDRLPRIQLAALPRELLRRKYRPAQCESECNCRCHSEFRATGQAGRPSARPAAPTARELHPPRRHRIRDTVRCRWLLPATPCQILR